MSNFTADDLNFILESLKYTKHNFENYPIGEKGYPSYEYKQGRISEVNSVITKVRAIIKEQKMISKTPKTASNTFHSIMAASVKGNPAPAQKKKGAKKK